MGAILAGLVIAAILLGAFRVIEPFMTWQSDNFWNRIHEEYRKRSKK